MYFAQGGHLATQDAPLLSDQVEAWQYGPVVQDLYHEFKDFGDTPTTRHAYDRTFVNGRLRVLEPSIPEEDTETQGFLAAVWDMYKGVSAIQLSNITYADGPPWDVTWRRNPGRKGVDIPDKEIKEYFSRSSAG